MTLLEALQAYDRAEDAVFAALLAALTDAGIEWDTDAIADWYPVSSRLRGEEVPANSYMIVVQTAKDSKPIDPLAVEMLKKRFPNIMFAFNPLTKS